MTQAELVTLCKSLGFWGEPDRCVIGSYYANLNPEKIYRSDTYLSTS